MKRTTTAGTVTTRRGGPPRRSGATDSRVRRARLILWAGILIIGGIALWMRYQELNRPASLLSEPGRRERQAKVVQVPAPRPAPEVRFLLERRKALGLTPAQESRLRKLQAQWSSESAETRAAASDAAGYLSERANPSGKERSGAPPREGRTDAPNRSGQAPSQRPVSLTDLREAAQPLGAVSGELAALRRSYWQRAEKVLTPAQRERLQPMLKQVTLRDLLPAGPIGAGAGETGARPEAPAPTEETR